MYNKEKPKCLNCGTSVSRRPKKYCDNNCQQEFQYKKYIKQWKCGEVTGNVGVVCQLSSHIRRYLFEKYDSKCCKCGWGIPHSIDGKIPLEVNHIDGNHEYSVEENLELICPNCHSLTDSYKSRNKGKGRKGRKKYSLYENT